MIATTDVDANRGSGSRCRRDEVFTSRRRLGWWAALAAVAIGCAGVPPDGIPAAAAQLGCAGDCNADGRVAVDDLIAGVNIALGSRAVADCPSLDGDGSGAVAINELVQAVLNALSGCPEPLAQGLQALRAGNLLAARDAFAAAQTAHPDDGATRLYALLSRVVVDALTDTRVVAALGAIGIELEGTLERFCDYTIIRPSRVASDAQPADAIVAAARDAIVPRAREALDGLRTEIDADTHVALDTSYLPSCLRPRGVAPLLDIDRGEMMSTAAVLQLLIGLVDLGGAYHLEVGLYDLFHQPLQALLDGNSELFRLKSVDNLTAARDELDQALGEALAAVEEIRTELDPQDDDVLVLLAQDADEADRYEDLVARVRQSLRVPAVIPAQQGLPHPQPLDLSRVFDPTFPSLRELLAFDANGNIDPTRFPDPTFHGVAEALTQADLDTIRDGGPRCAPCRRDIDCVGFVGLRLYCGYCDSYIPYPPYYDPNACLGEQRRCVAYSHRECADGTFY